jgi:hypothetical protein
LSITTTFVGIIDRIRKNRMHFMRKLIVLGIILLACCNPYQPYPLTHYHITAEIDPISGIFDVNLQMVYVPGIQHNDSIEFHLDRSFSISSIGAQELIRYESYNDDRLVLYIQNPVIEGDQLHISISYSGKPGAGFSPAEDLYIIDSSLNWYPFNTDIPRMTCRLRIGLPEGYYMDGDGVQEKPMNNYFLESREPVSSIRFAIFKNAN